MNNEMVKTAGGHQHMMYVEDDQNYRAGRMPELGAKLEYSDGRKYVFVSTDQAHVAGKAVAKSGGYGVAAGDLGSAEVGVEEVELTVVGATLVNLYAGGFLVLETGTSYEIVSSTATAAAGVVTLVLANALTQEIDGGAGFISPPPCELVQRATNLSNVIGFAPRDVAIVSGKKSFFWVQTGGIGAVLCGASAGLTEGSAFTVSSVGVAVVGSAHDDVILGKVIIDAPTADNKAFMAEICVG